VSRLPAPARNHTTDTCTDAPDVSDTCVHTHARTPSLVVIALTTTCPGACAAAAGLHELMRACTRVCRGPGKDQALLAAAGLAPTASDLSFVFVERYRRACPGAEVLQLDARTLAGLQAGGSGTGLPVGAGPRTFDCVYSNKALDTLDDAQLAASLRRQAAVLTPAGVVCHSFWLGEGCQVPVAPPARAPNFTLTRASRSCCRAPPRRCLCA